MTTATGVRGRLPVRALLWGRTDADLWRALSHAQGAPSRGAWEFVTEQQQTLTSPTCPLNLEDPRALAAEQGYGWAYVVLRADGGAR